jgi:hypothetical protein
MLLLSVLLLILANRDLRHPIWSGLFSANRWVLRLVLVLSLLLAMLMFWPALGRMMGTVLPTGSDWFLAGVGALLMLLWLEFLRRVGIRASAAG